MTSPGTAPRGLLATYWWLIAAVLVATLGGAAFVASTRPVSYTSRAQVVVLPEPTIGVAIEPQMATERTIASSGAVAALAAPHLSAGSHEGSAGLSVSVILDTNVLEIAYTAPTAHEAYDGALAFSDAYVAYRNQGQKTKLADVVTSPKVPASGSGTSLLLVLAVGVFAGAALGVGAAWAWDRATDRIRTAGDLVRITGLTVVAELPRWPRKVGLIAPPGRAAQAVGFAATRLRALAGGQRTGIVLVVTSPHAGGGTTTVAANLATALAGQGCEVVLVCADIHAPQMHPRLGVAPFPGLVDVLHGTCAAGEALRGSGRERLRVLPAGASAVYGEPLNVELLRLVLAELAANAIVVVDAPPLLSSPESLSLASHAHAVLLVADLRAGTRAEAVAARDLLGEEIPTAWITTHPRRPRRVRAHLASLPSRVRRLRTRGGRGAEPARPEPVTEGAVVRPAARTP